MSEFPDSKSFSFECIVAFVLGMVLQGPFCAHLLERHKRKSLYLNALFLIAISSLGCILLPTHHRLTIVFCLFAEGVAYGISQIAMGGTIVNDMLLSAHRTKGDCIYGWTTRLGIPCGILAGTLLNTFFNGPTGYGWSLCTLALSYVFVAQTTIPVKAPVKMAVFTLDRFFLPSSWPRMLMLLPIALLTGCMLFYVKDILVIASLLAGGLIALCADQLLTSRLRTYSRLSIGYSLVALSLLMYALCASSFYGMILCMLITSMGLATASANLLAITVEKSEHCQRGTAQNTHLLVWGVGLAAGYSLCFLA